MFGWVFIDSALWSTYIQVQRQIMQYKHYESSSELTLAHHGFAGCIAGCVSTALVVPIENVKTKLQVQYHSHSARHTAQYKGPIDCARKLIASNGLLRGLYSPAAVPATLMFRSSFGVLFASNAMWHR